MAGDAGEDDRLQLIRRPHPQLTLEYLSSITFPIAAASCLSPTWTGSDAELEKLCELEVLSFFEWKDVYRSLREKGVTGINAAALSGDSTLENVGFRLTGSHQCPD